MNDVKQQQLELMSRQEGRKLFMLLLVLVMGLSWLFTRPHTPMPTPADGPAEVGVAVQPPAQDAARVLTTLARVEERERVGEPAPVITGVFEPDPQVLAAVDDTVMDLVEEPAFYQMLAAVRSRPDEERDRLPELVGTFTWEQLNHDAGRAQARGKYVKVTGRFITPLFQRVLERYPNEADLAWVWQGMFRSQGRGYFVT
ncbi:MAG: hypothetical protein KIT58_12130, partial [Planctomycetota bacterium]|nr:hypothetical protein [Planctomycetota bacterium]